MLTNTAEPVLGTESVGKEFGGVWVLSQVDFDLKQGEVHALIGENGAGKSTLVKILSGVHRASEGRLLLRGEEIVPRNVRDSEAFGIRTVHQEIHQVPFMTVAENIFIGSEHYRKVLGIRTIDRKSMNEVAGRVLAELGMPIDINRPAHTLDASLQRIVEIAKALSHKPELLILDEPTTSLGERERDRLLSVIEELKGKVGIIYVSHNLDEIMRLSDRITVLRDGQNVGTIHVDAASESELIRLMIGRKSYSVFKRNRGSKSRTQELPVLRIENVHTQKLKDVSLQLRRGEIVGVAGVVGAGKSELARAIFGIDPVESGRFYLDGEEFRPSPPVAVDKGIALIPEERQRQGLVLRMPVSKNMTLAYLWNWASRGIISMRREDEAARQFIDVLGIKTTGPEQLVRFLSGGNQQKVILSRWLSGDFKVALFDDATRGIDINTKQDVYRLIDDLSKAGKAILYLSSYLPELLSLCHRIVVMCEGRIVGEYEPGEDWVEESILTAMLGGKVDHGTFYTSGG